MEGVDIFQGADVAEVEARRRYQVIFFLLVARRRIRLSRRRMGTSALTPTELKVLVLLQHEVSDMLQRAS